METEILKYKPINKTWSEVFSAPCDISVQKILTGYVKVKKYNIIKTKDKSYLRLPVYCYILKHESGSYLIDAGLDTSHQQKEYGRQKGLFKSLSACKATQNKNQSIAEYLKEQDIILKGIF